MMTDPNLLDHKNKLLIVIALFFVARGERAANEQRATYSDQFPSHSIVRLKRI